MKSIRFKCNLYICLVIILNYQICHVLSAKGNTGDSDNTFSKVLPLILLRTSNSLQLPSEASLQSVFLFWEKVKFNSFPDQEQFYFCDGETNAQAQRIQEIQEEAQKNNLTSEVVDSYCLFQKTFSLEIFKTGLPTCLHEPEPIITKIYENNDDSGELTQLQCGPDKKSYYFRFGYRIWLNKGFLEKVSHLDPSITNAEAYPFRGVIDFEIYRFCYNETSKKVLHTEHKTLSPRLLFFDKLKEENEKTYDMSICAYNDDHDNFQFEKLRSAYEANNNFDEVELWAYDREIQNSVMVPPRKKFQIQKLVPSNDFPFALWRRPTFHYLNTKLMHEDLSPMWDYITKIIEQKAKRDNVRFNIYTGTFNVSNTDRSKVRFNNYLEAPEIWIKIVQFHDIRRPNTEEVRRGVAIIANNYLNITITVYLSKYCTINYCKNFTGEKYPTAKEHIMCCEVSDTIKQLFGIDLKIDDILEIEDFIWKY